MRGFIRGCVITVLVSVGVLHASSVTFTSAPAIVRSDTGFTVTFAVSGAVDVEVAILGPDSAVLRHLATGVLGGDTIPPAPLVAGLAQSIHWNGNNDDGLPVFGDNFQVRVRLGIYPQWKYRINTDSIPGSHRPSIFYPPKSMKVIPLTHPVWPRITTEHSTPDLQITVNKKYEEIYIHLTNATRVDQYRYDGNTGALLQIHQVAAHSWQHMGELVMDWRGENGYWAVGGTSEGSTVWRYSRLLTPVAWPDTRIQKVAGLTLGHQITPGHAVGPDNALYVYNWPATDMYFNNEYNNDQTMLVTRVDSTGVVTHPALLNIQTWGNGLKIDSKGNIYVGARVKPAGVSLPQEIDSAVGVSTATRSLRWWADEMYGSILKFRPEPGSGLIIDTDSSGDRKLQAGKDIGVVSKYYVKASGLEWYWFGYTNVCTHWGQRNSDAVFFNDRGSPCTCMRTRFDVDRYGRLWVPDPFQYKIQAMDNNKNPIFRMTHREMPSGTGILPIGWVDAVEVTDKHMFVADHINDQVVCFELLATAEASAAFNIAVEAGPTRLSVGPVQMLGATPNPFTASSRLRFFARPGLDTRAPRALIADHAGRVIRILDLSKEGQEGFFNALWDGKNGSGLRVASGIYHCRFEAAGLSAERTLILAR